jgi:hypothetical protein
MPAYLGTPQLSGPLPPDDWLLHMSVLRRSADGMVIWTGPWGPWDEQLPWWPVTREFVGVPAPSASTAPAPAPSAPQALSLRASGPVLSWADTSASEDGFIVERSTDGINFKVWGGTARNVTTWQDTRIASGATYHYRVRAFNSFGTSAYSAAVSGPVSRLALVPNEAERFEAAAGVSIADGHTVNLIDAGDYLLYRSVDFAGGADQFGVSLGAGDATAGQRIEVRLDSLSGPVIGTLTIAGTGDFDRFTRQTAAVALTTGVHDVYLTFRPSADGTRTTGAAKMDLFQFARGAAPARPTRFVANSAGGRVDLTWADNSMDEANFVVERSTDGLNFATLATLAAGQRSYSDAAIEFGKTYSYRVRAVNSSGRSEPSDVDLGVRTVRDAYSLLQAEQFDVSLGVIPNGTTVGHTDNMDYLGFLGVDLAAGARTIAIRHGVARGAEGQAIEVRLDDPAGPLIGTLVTRPTGTYVDMQIQYATVQSVGGVHDVYLVFRGAFGISNIDWFTFLP